MKVLRCRKCGTVITTENNYVEMMTAEINRLNSLAAKGGKNRNIYQQQSAQLFKLMKQIIYTTSEIGNNEGKLSIEKYLLVDYLISNGLITKEKLHEIETEAGKRMKIQDERNSKELERLYGEAQSICREKGIRNFTENKALRNVR